ncbi:MAG: hypothetical protein ACMG57_01360 [Candidatus Dojkabacteria bacterium]
MAFGGLGQTLSNMTKGLKKAAVENLSPMNMSFVTRLPYIAQGFIERNAEDTKKIEQDGVFAITSKIQTENPEKKHENQDGILTVKLNNINCIMTVMPDGATWIVDANGNKKISSSDEFVTNYLKFFEIAMQANIAGMNERFSTVVQLLASHEQDNFKIGAQELEDLLKDFQEQFLIWCEKYESEFKRRSEWNALGSLSFTIPVKDEDMTTLVSIQIGNLHDSGHVAVMLSNNDFIPVSDLFETNDSPQVPNKLHTPNTTYTTYMYFYGNSPQDKKNLAHVVRPGGSIYSARITAVSNLPQDAIALVTTDGVKLNGSETPVDPEDDATIAYIPLNIP